MNIQSDNRSFDFSISKNIEFVLNLTDAIARKHWHDVKNVIKCTYNEFFETLLRSATQAFRKIYLMHFDDIDTKDDDSFITLIEKFVGGKLLDHIHYIIYSAEEKSKPRQTLGCFGIGVNYSELIADQPLEEEDNEHFFKIEGITIEIYIEENNHCHSVSLYFHGDHDQIEKFQINTGILVKSTNLFDDGVVKELEFFEFGES